MKFSFYTRQALVNLKSAKLRSFLAVLGILVGTAAVVALLSSGQLATEKALDEFKQLGTDLMALAIYPQKQGQSASEQRQFELEQWRSLPKHVQGVNDIAPYSNAYQTVSYQGRELKGALIGADEKLASILKLKLTAGRFVSQLETYEHVAVIGQGLLMEMNLISAHEALGKQILIGQQVYTVIGVLAPWSGSAFFNGELNQSVVLPLQGLAMLSKNTKLNHAVLNIAEDAPIESLTQRIRQLIKIQSPGLQAFPRSAQQIIASMENQGRIFTLLLAVIGGISLLVGGIGVMNVMLVSVSERKKEIGIRKALGAKNKQIQALFLQESLILALIGGGLGVVIGQLLTLAIAGYSHWPLHFYIMPMLIGFGVSALTGIISGYYPARRASRLDAIASLR